MPIEALRSVQDQFEAVVRFVKPKRLAAEMQRADKAFFMRYFKGYRPEKIGRGRIKMIAQREIFAGDGHELFANLIIVHWNEANSAIFREMLAHVQTINEDVEAIEEIEDQKAHAIIDDLLKRFSPEACYICVRLNGVRFREEVIQTRLLRGESAPENAPESEDA